MPEEARLQAVEKDVGSIKVDVAVIKTTLDAVSEISHKTSDSVGKIFDRIGEAMVTLEGKADCEELDKKTDKLEFTFWRNLLVGGILVNILALFLGILLKSIL